MTDEGLYGTSTEYVIVKDKQAAKAHVFYRSGTGLRYINTFRTGVNSPYARFIRRLASENPGARITIW